MIQQINFYPLLPTKSKYSLTPALGIRVCVGFIILLMVVYLLNLLIYFWQNNKLSDLAQTQQLAQQQLSELNEHYSDAASPKPLSWQNQQLAAELSAKQMSLVKLKQRGEPNEQGYSGYLLAFAKTIVPNVWLTNIHIINTTQQIALTGNALDSTSIMQFIQSMSREMLFNNKAFNVLRLENSTTDSNVINFTLSTKAREQNDTAARKNP